MNGGAWTGLAPQVTFNQRLKESKQISGGRTFLQMASVGRSNLPLVFGWTTRLRMFLTFFNGCKQIKRRVVFHDT